MQGARGRGHGGRSGNSRSGNGDSGRQAQGGRPTHFLALRMAHQPSVQDAIRQVHSSIVDHVPGLAGACESPMKAHITLLLLSLPQEGQGGQGSSPPTRLAAALRAMATLPEALEGCGANAPLQLHAKGLSSFGDQVLFLEVAEGGNEGTVDGGRTALMRLQACVAQHFQELRFETPYPLFAPHITIAKMASLRQQGRGPGGRGRGRGRSHQAERWGAWGENDQAAVPTRIPQSAYSANINIDAGVALVHEVELCALSSILPLQPDGYYHVLAAVKLQAGDPRVSYSPLAQQVLTAVGSELGT